MSPPILHSRWYEEKSWIYFYSLESLAGVAHQVEISVQQPGPATAPLQAGVAADHWSPVRRGWSSAWPQQPPSLDWSRSSLTVAWLETLQSPTCCPAPWLPHSAEVRSKEKLSQGTITYLPQWDVRSQENTILCKLITFVQNAGEADLAVLVIIHSVPFVQDKLFINKKKLNETTFLTTYGKNSSLLLGEISLSLAYISKTPSLQKNLYC